MAEDEEAENNLIEAIKRVNNLPWPSVREKALRRGLQILADLLNLEIVKVELPEKPGDSAATLNTGKGSKDNG